MPKFIVIILFVIITLPCFAGEVFPVPQLPFEPLSYTCFMVQDTIRIDGKLDDKDWLASPWTADFVDIEGSLKPLPSKQTRVKMLYNKIGLYIAAELQEDHIWANVTQRDDIVFFDNDFEIFIDPDGDTHDYYELEINALGTLWDLFITAPYYRVKDWPALYSWDARNIQYAIDIDGTINNPNDTDKKWTLEMLIPWSDIKDQAHMDCPPKPGDQWRMNFSRVQWQTDIIDGKYVKKQGVPESNWVWSPQGLIAMHYPERWGYVKFERRAEGAHRDIDYFPKEKAGEFLRQLFYKQKQYWFDHQKYAKTLKQLGVKTPAWNGKKYPVIIETTSQSFIITLPIDDKIKDIHINETGLTW
jgi:hypothetical protein